MASIWTALKVVTGIILAIFVLAIIHLILTSPALHNIRSGIYNIAQSINPQLAQLLKETYIVTVKITGYAYEMFKTIINALYRIVNPH